MNENAKLLYHEVKRGLEKSEVVKVNVELYAQYLGVSLRSAQRYLAELKDVDAFEMCRRKRDGARYFKKIGSPPLSQLLSLVDLEESGRIDQPDALVAFVAISDSLFLSYLYIDKSKRVREEAVANRDNGDRSSANGNNSADVSIWFCHVCKLSALLLLDTDEAKIAKLFRAGVEAPAVLKRYSPERRPNYWYSGYWKGRDKNARPTIVDIMQTWEMSAGYVYKPHHAWPGVAEIQMTIKAIMVDSGPRKPKTALEEMSKYGYDKIIEKIPGGYIHMTRMSIEKMNIEIAKAVRGIREEEKELIKE